MKECHLCHKPLNARTGKIKRDNLLFCMQCAPQWEQRRKQEALTAINEGNPPVEVFHIPRITTPNPDNPVNNNLLGDLIFMDKGLCFAGLANLNAGQNAASLLLGVVGTIVEVTQRQVAKGRALQTYHAQITQLHPHGLQAVLMGTARLIFIPRDIIKTVQYGRLAGGLIVDTDNFYANRIFKIIGGKKTYRKFEPQIRDYMGT